MFPFIKSNYPPRCTGNRNEVFHSGVCTETTVNLKTDGLNMLFKKLHVKSSGAKKRSTSAY